MLLVDQPHYPRLDESRRKHALAGGSGGSVEAQRIEELSRTELQSGKELARVGTLPGKEGYYHKTPLATANVRLRLLLVGGCRPLGVRDVAESGARKEAAYLARQNPNGGRGKRSGNRPKPPNLSWPLALRRVKAWLEPHTLLWRY